MAVFQIEDGIATGRGFSGIDANGICSKFMDWIVRTPAAGGPGWFIIADYSANVFKNFAPTDITLATENINIPAHGFAHCHTVRFSTTTTAPTGLTNNTTYYVIYVDTNNIKLATTFNNAVAGTAINITAQGSGTHTISPMEYFIVVSDTNAAPVNSYNSGPGGNAPKYIRFGYYVSNAGYINIHGLLYWDTTLRMGRAYWTGREILTYDAADFVYSFRGGAEQMMIATRTGTTWHYMIIDDWIGDPNLVEAASKIGVLQSGISAGSNVTCQLAVGEALNFTANNYYFIFDFTTTTVGVAPSQVDYVKIASVDIVNDRIVINTLTNNFNSGAIISPYAHRFYSKGVSRNVNVSNGSGIFYDDVNSYGSNAKIPYYSTFGGVVYSGQSSGLLQASCNGDYLSSIISRMAPDDMGRYAAQRPVLTENITSGLSGGPNRSYGIMKNLYVSTPGTALAWSDYRVIGGRQWLYVGNYGFEVFTLNTESLA